MKIALIGYGKMGQAIEKIALQSNHEIVLRVGSQNADQLNKDTLSTADVAIEFSQPELALNNILLCLENQLPVVSGTTGWLADWAKAESLCREKDGALFYAANFSVGVNLFFALNRHLAELMENWTDYDVAIQEVHHRYKADHPSGTGLVLAEEIVKGLSRKLKWVDGPASSLSELGVSSQRVGQVPGTHEVTYDSTVDTISIKHTARSREGFAQGALLAASWLIGRQGIFGMQDLLFSSDQ